MFKYDYEEQIIKIMTNDFKARLFILSDSKKRFEWSEDGINSSFKFIQKLLIKVLKKIKNNKLNDQDEELKRNK